MFRPFPIFIGLRYTRAKRRNHFISFITLSSMLGIALGVAALITVLSVMNGFQSELRASILGMASQATISGYGGPLRDWRTLLARVRRFPEVTGVAPYVQSEAMITFGSAVRGAVIRGVSPRFEPQVSDIEKHLRQGHLSALQPGRFGILLGSELAQSLGVRVGDKVTLVAPEIRTTVAGILPRLKRFTVVGIFSVNNAQYDAGFAEVNLRDAQRLFELGRGVTGLRLKFHDLYQAPRLSREIARRLGGAYWVTDWTEQNANFFKALRTEKTVMFVILAMIVAVAAFNIVSTLIMVVTDKQADIAILRTLGATPRSIMGVFVVQGTVIGVAGVLVGALCGIVLALNVETVLPWIEHTFHVQFLSPQVYYISQVPSQLRWHDVYTTTAVAFVMSALATLYPAWRASRTQPADALRYE